MSPTQTFRTAPASYAALCGVLSVPFALAVVGAIRGAPDPKFLLLSAIMPVAAGLWLSAFRLRLDESGIDYREPFGRSFSVSYTDVASLDSRTVVFGRGFAREWTLHLRDGRGLRLNLKPFGKEACRTLYQRIRPGAWTAER